MDRFWDVLTEPALTAIRARTIVEVGSETGNSTKKLLAYCERHDAVLHAIDPAPRFDVAAWQQQYGPRFVMHRTLSLQALPTIDRFDAVLLDGDHNWYTVFHELKQIEQRSRELGQAFPLVLLHDVGWPYGRRDLYYDPVTVPEEFRQPHARRGMRPGSPELVDGGLNPSHWNATAENTPRNGVLTAVDDFLKESEQPLEMLVVPGFYGLGILFQSQLLKQNPEFAKLLQIWNLPRPVEQYIQKMELSRLQLEISNFEMRSMIRKLKSQLQPRPPAT